jgi:hypothetical protein
MIRRTLAVTTAVVAVTLAATSPAVAAPKRDDLRIATFNASLNRAAAGELVADLSTPDDPQAREVAEVVQRVRPDVLLVNEFDYAPEAVDLFRANYLEVGQNGAEPIEYPYAFIAPSNTGVPSGFDLDDNGTVGGPNDALAFGSVPRPVRDARALAVPAGRGADVPGLPLAGPARQPHPPRLLHARGARGPAAVVEVALGRAGAGRPAHGARAGQPPRPRRPFDGPEDRNGTRNADEILFWRHYVQPGPASRALYDDEGRRGGLRPGERFVIMGDQNSDPFDGDSLPGAAQQILTARRVIDPRPGSDGGVEAARLQGGPNLTHRGDPRVDTADFSEPVPGNLRVDYVLPSRPLQVRGSGVFWPVAADPLARLNDASDHHLVWVDLRVR